MTATGLVGLGGLCLSVTNSSDLVVAVASEDLSRQS